MSGNLIEFLKLYEATSASGKRYWRGRAAGLRLVCFPVEAKDGQDAHIQVYVDGSPDRATGSPERKAVNDSGPHAHRDSTVANNGHGTRSNQYASRKASGSNERRASASPPFDDDLPFGGG